MTGVHASCQICNFPIYHQGDGRVVTPDGSVSDKCPNCGEDPLTRSRIMLDLLHPPRVKEAKPGIRELRKRLLWGA